MEQDVWTKDLGIVTSIQFVALKLACPCCGAPIELGGRLELTSGQAVTEPCCVCERCGNRAHLALDARSG